MTKTGRFAADHSVAAARESLTTLSLAASLVGLGCAGSVQGGVNAGGEDDDGRRLTEIVHEPCDISDGSTQKTDVNRDGRADIMVAAGCSAYDLNFDGRVDSWVYVDTSGKTRRREMDFDKDGRVDELQLYDNGVIAQKHRSTARPTRLDTWEFFSGGHLVRTERDSDGDGVVDQWWEYPTAGCPVIHSDIDRDGKPDPDTAVDYCKETGYVPPERSATRGTESPSFERPGSTPVEVENPSAKAGSSPDESGAPEDTPQSPDGSADQTGEGESP